jgi:CubicO group peptidase (beta-lactamase class C family)
MEKMLMCETVAGGPLGRRDRFFSAATLALQRLSVFRIAHEPQQSFNPAACVSQGDDVFAAYSGEGVPGAAIAVLRENRPVFERFLGVADIRSGARVERESNFRLASVSKQFTAALILGLIDERRLRLDDRVRSALPEMPRYADDIQILHLLQHTSGLPDHEDLVDDKQRDQITDADVVRLLHASTLLFFEPGSGFRYSNTGYVVLGLIAARAAGRPLEDLFRERLFEPSGMKRTVAYLEGTNAIEHRAYGHSMKDGAVRSSDQSVTSATLGDGGIYSSIDDLTRWCHALDAEQIIGWPTVRRAFDPLKLSNDNTVPYSMSWEVHQWNGRRVYSHAGSTTGFRNFIARFVDDRVAVIVLTNRSNPVPAELLAHLLQEHLPGWKSSPESFLLCQQIVGLRPMDRHARPHLESGHAP